jgi:proteasome lid subunit RPN8/RPN11
MRAAAPDNLTADRQCLIVLDRVLRAAEPEEGCALLLGECLEAGWLLLRIWPCRNVWPEAAERSRRFAIDPREQLLAQKWARARGLEVLGAGHSHPNCPAVPSATDQVLTALRPTLMVIRGAAGECRAWWLDERRAGEAGPCLRELPFRAANGTEEQGCHGAWPRLL